MTLLQGKTGYKSEEVPQLYIRVTKSPLVI